MSRHSAKQLAVYATIAAGAAASIGALAMLMGAVGDVRVALEHPKLAAPHSGHATKREVRELADEIKGVQRKNRDLLLRIAGKLGVEP